MKLRKVLATVVAAATAVTTLTATTSAYDFKTPSDGFSPEKDGFYLGVGWDKWTNVPNDQLEGLNENTIVKITFTTDADGDYWSLKPYSGEGQEGFVDPDNTVNPDAVFGGTSTPGDSFNVEGMTEIQFKIAPSVIEKIKASDVGLEFVGHCVTLMSLELINDASADDNKDEDTTTAEDNAPANDNNDSNTTPDKDQPNTGIEGVAILMGVGALAAAAVVISKKRK
ncbi:MAG: NPXTG-anchored protein [Ruminococcaceae bacterium]|nr:NPXTG-anchored protein [Oscillospiraceae bacterium]